MAPVRTNMFRCCQVKFVMILMIPKQEVMIPKQKVMIPKQKVMILKQKVMIPMQKVMVLKVFNIFFNGFNDFKWSYMILMVFSWF